MKHLQNYTLINGKGNRKEESINFASGEIRRLLRLIKLDQGNRHMIMDIKKHAKLCWNLARQLESK